MKIRRARQQNPDPKPNASAPRPSHKTLHVAASLSSTLGLVIPPPAGLLDNASFQRAALIDCIVPSTAGVYAFRLHVDSLLPEPFDSLLNARTTRVIYIGKATSLNSRMLGNELRGLGHGTFFRSIGAALGYRPKAGSLANKVNKKNFSFEVHDRDAIVAWINSNLEVAWRTVPAADVPALESVLILEHTPLLNIQGNPRALVELKNLRRECRDIASAPALKGLSPGA